MKRGAGVAQASLSSFQVALDRRRQQVERCGWEAREMMGWDHNHYEEKTCIQTSDFCLCEDNKKCNVQRQCQQQRRRNDNAR